MNIRLFVEKKPEYRVEANAMLQELRTQLNIDIEALRLLHTYDIFDIEESTLCQAKQSVFAEAMVDNVYEDIDVTAYTKIAYEYLPGQYDQRADSADQCLRLINASTKARVKSGELLLLQGNINDDDMHRIHKHLINTVEARVKDLSQMQMDETTTPSVLPQYEGFLTLDAQALAIFKDQTGLAMTVEDLLHIQAYFQKEGRTIKDTELRVLDTYWSDHCRHTTFETILSSIQFAAGHLEEQIKHAYELYNTLRQQANRAGRPQTLMDMATIAAKEAVLHNKLHNLEISEEINACSVYIDVNHDGVSEKWLLMFKNETHNHPTEIEPFGGASTCIGGAIRDPLSGRSYVYQAMRISGCGDVLQPIEETMPNKLPQRVIASKAARGNAAYGNQIGLPTTHVKEYYHPRFVAKHMEVGAVVGANKAENVVRLSCTPGDVILLLGGRTGRDGIGGATGSSKEHNEQSLSICASEVQKGNAVEERKIQRLFRHASVSKMIKKCNDFGAGGVCVAIGELAESLRINLDAVKTKYAGLNATEIAISESQERMAVVIAPADKEAFLKAAKQENLEAYQVAEVTDTQRLQMVWKNELVVDISRAFIDTNGAAQSAEVLIDTGTQGENPFTKYDMITYESALEVLADCNVCAQKGLIENFDASITGTNVLMPHGGMTQLTPTQASVQKLPMPDGKTKTCSILTCGYEPAIAVYSPYLGAVYAVTESLAKIVACGGSLTSTYLSFQEYFERLQKDPKKWGIATQALLGSIEAQDAFGCYAIGGKDSMSGTYKELHVPPSLLSFACGVSETDRIVSNHFKKPGSYIYLAKPDCDVHTPDLAAYKAIFLEVETLIRKNVIRAASVVEAGGVFAALVKMSLGDNLGFHLHTKVDMLNLQPGAMLLETEVKLSSENFLLIGTVSKGDYQIAELCIGKHQAKEAYLKTLQDLYPIYTKFQTAIPLTVKDTASDIRRQSKVKRDRVRVLVLVFPGTNCEYDTARAFHDAGGESEIFVFQNQDEASIHASIKAMADKILHSDIIAFPGGFSSGDEPDGSAKYIVNVLLNETIKNAVHQFLDQDGLIIGICNGFQALIKSGLLPYGRIQVVQEDSMTLFRNDINRHVSTFVRTRVASNQSVWLRGNQPGDVHLVPVSHGEGKLVGNPQAIQTLFDQGQVVFQYCDDAGNPTMSPQWNINGSMEAIEGIVSVDGKILGKMAHSERYVEGCFQNIEGNKQQNIFQNGINYFLHR